ncbi:hypothetical protein BIV57_00205 [Mangrovactinospora gilvigrisea]|uniref:Uncharacterized protein n=1 Tax=Mangrovactinospora gilvigrisea TaxID=1428644 RepID=A0A1J7BKY6_9ACTN|nr:hypothetical protein [Mangrovactinospora gilvigrisea]OIV39310.1 hypothetical protein BIV57_00205 [Mangrovactinospora gilvigrisea]
MSDTISRTHTPRTSSATGSPVMLHHQAARIVGPKFFSTAFVAPNIHAGLMEASGLQETLARTLRPFIQFQVEQRRMLDEVSRIAEGPIRDMMNSGIGRQMEDISRTFTSLAPLARYQSDLMRIPRHLQVRNPLAESVRKFSPLLLPSRAFVRTVRQAVDVVFGPVADIVAKMFSGGLRFGCRCYRIACIAYRALNDDPVAVEWLIAEVLNIREPSRDDVSAVALALMELMLADSAVNPFDPDAVRAALRRHMTTASGHFPLHERRAGGLRTLSLDGPGFRIVAGAERTDELGLPWTERFDDDRIRLALECLEPDEFEIARNWAETGERWVNLERTGAWAPGRVERTRRKLPRIGADLLRKITEGQA